MDYMKYITIQVIKKTDRSEVVFAAVDELDVPVVIKRLQGTNPEIYRSIASIRNPHIPKIYCVEEQGDELCIAEEYIDGRTLDVYLAEETLTDWQKLELMVHLCEALEVLHLCKPPIIHRDIKPSNILITTDGVLKIIDFDASRQYKTEKNTSDTRLLGTIEYAAPEQFGYAQTDVRSDIYSVGVVFSELAMKEKTSFAKEWKRLVDKCTNFDPENRYKDVSELKKDLMRCIQIEKHPIAKRWLMPVAIMGVFVLMLVVGGLQLHRENNRIPAESGATPQVQTDKEQADIADKVEERDPIKEPEEQESKETEEIPGVILKEDHIVWNMDSLPVVVGIQESASCKIQDVFLCRQAEENNPFSEELISLSKECYEITENGKKLNLNAAFSEQYKKQEETVLYVVFDDGRGERVWLTYRDGGM